MESLFDYACEEAVGFWYVIVNNDSHDTTLFSTRLHMVLGLM